MGPERNCSAAGQITIDLDESDSRPERETESNHPTHSYKLSTKLRSFLLRLG